MRIESQLMCSILLCISDVGAEKERMEDGAMSSKIRGHRDDHRVDADAIMGSRKEADALGSLDAEEAYKRLIAVARKMDTDKDGKVSKDELTNWIEKSIKSVDDEEADERLREMDTNNDSKISWKEYVLDSFPHDREEDLDAEDRKLLAEDKKYFDAADLNKDGMLNREELAAFLTPENHEHMHRTLVELTTEEKDEDKDGAISLKEFLGDMADNTHSEWHVVESERFRTEYDTNGDGKLTGDEVLHWLIPNVRLTAELEAAHIMERADKDGDGMLSMDEVGQQYELFVSSEATKYGEQLDRIPHQEL